jgi:hypothetical protein
MPQEARTEASCLRAQGVAGRAWVSRAVWTLGHVRGGWFGAVELLWSSCADHDTTLGCAAGRPKLLRVAVRGSDCVEHLLVAEVVKCIFPVKLDIDAVGLCLHASTQDMAYDLAASADTHAELKRCKAAPHAGACCQAATSSNAVPHLSNSNRPYAT